MSRIRAFVIAFSFSLLSLAFFAAKIFAVTPAQICSSDFNQDGTVNLSDYTIFTKNFLATTITNPRTDITKDGKVNLSDYTIFAGSFLQRCVQSPTVQNTPTPVVGPGHYYVSTTGTDSNPGTAAAPFKTIQKAILATKSDASAGATIHILPGTYREALLFDGVHGTSTDPVNVVAENGPGTVFLYGSESSQDPRLTWSHSASGATFPSAAASHIYSADISAWGAIPELAYDTTGNASRLPKAHEPDFDVTTEWKYHENWWKADGAEGTSMNTLIDATNDASGTYPEAAALAGNLKNINGFTGSFLTGGRVFFKDGVDGHDLYNATIAAHDGSTGKITFDRTIPYYNGKPAVSAYTKYYVEGASQLLDQPGEWYVNPTTKRLYIWPSNDVNPSTLKLEFAVRLNAMQIKNSTYLNFKNLNISYTNYAYALSTGPDGAIRFYGYSTDQTSHITFDGVNVTHNGIGFRLYQSNSSTTSTGSLSHLTIKNSVVDDSDGYAMMVWHWPLPAPNPFIHHLWIENTEFGHMGYRGSGVGIFMQYPEKIVFTNNYLHHSSHNAIEIQGGKGSGNAMILVQNNLSENNCNNGSDCGAFKFWNTDTGNGTRNILVMNNIFRGTKGWSYVNAAQNKKVTVQGSGYWGNGYYSDVVASSTPGNGCAITLYRNMIYNNSAAGVHYTRSRDQCAFNNVIAQNGFGIEMNNFSPTTDGSFSNKILGNILLFTEPGTNTNFAKSYGITSRINKADEGKLTVDRNIYQIVGSNSADMFKQDVSYTNVGTWKSISDVRSNSPWEDNGKDGSGVLPPLPMGQSADISVYEKAFGVTGVTLPSEVESVMHALENEFGMTIQPSAMVGRSAQ